MRTGLAGKDRLPLPPTMKTRDTAIPAARSVRSNILSNLGGQVTILLVTLFATRSMFHGLGPSEFGLVYFTLVLNVLIATAADLGVSTTIVREISRELRHDGRYVRDLVQTAGVVYWGLYLLLIVSAVLLAPFMAHHFLRLPAVQVSMAVNTIRLLSVGALLGLPRTLYASVCRGLQRMDVANAIDVGTLGAQQLGIIVLIATGQGLLSILIWITATFAANVVAYVSATAWLLSPAHVLPTYRRGVVRRNFSFMWRMVGLSALIAVHTQTDKVAVGRLLPIAVAGEYAVAATVMQRAAIAPSAIAQAAFPSFSAAVARGDEAAALRAYQRLQSLMCVITGMMFGGLVFLAPVLYRYVLDERTANLLVLPTALLGCAYFLNAALTLPYVYSLAMNRADIMLASHAASLVFVLPVAFALVAWLGMTGAALSWIWFHVVAYAIGGRRIARECLHESLRGWLLQISIIGAPGLVIDAAGVVILAVTRSSAALVAVVAGATCQAIYAVILLALSRLSFVPGLASVRSSVYDIARQIGWRRNA